jgi:SAM-dependent methyltransferase
MPSCTITDPIVADSCAPWQPPTLVMRLQGGIGNQLFQLAYAERLACSTGRRVVFDVGSFAADAHGRESLLPRLWPDAPLLDASQLPQADVRLIREDPATWPGSGPLPLALPPMEGVSHVLLDGYWQDHRVADVERIESLRARIEAGIGAAARGLGEQIRGHSRPTALHVRQRDYRHHGLCSPRYYLEALRWLAARRGPLDLFVWTDEPNATAHWLREAGIAARVVATGDDLADLWLMAQCRHHVISNSSYSWWGAMLADSRDVIAPLPWSLLSRPSPTLLPPHWRAVANALEQPSSAAPIGAALDDEQFRLDRDAFLAQGRLPPDWELRLRPCHGDATATTAFDAHYVYHTAWAARRLHANPVPQHVDIGSDLRFATLASAFQPMRFLDYRPAAVRLPGLECGSANLLQLDLPDDSVRSLSCMHVVEHIGLGRYGDPIDFHGSDKAMTELARVLEPGGLLYFVVPVGRPAVVFNAHRIFRARDIVLRFGALELVEFSLVDDIGAFHEHVSLATSDTLCYGCGCFVFRKPARRSAKPAAAVS